MVPYLEDGLEKPLAYVVLRGEGAGDAPVADDLAEFVKSTIARYKFPRRIRFVEALPRNDRGKVDRKELRSRIEKDGLEGSHNTDPKARPAPERS